VRRQFAQGNGLAVYKLMKTRHFFECFGWLFIDQSRHALGVVLPLKYADLI